jgi:regulator of replication initiation timing
MVQRKNYLITTGKLNSLINNVKLPGSVIVYVDLASCLNTGIGITDLSKTSLKTLASVKTEHDEAVSNITEMLSQFPYATSIQTTNISLNQKTDNNSNKMGAPSNLGQLIADMNEKMLALGEGNKNIKDELQNVKKELTGTKQELADTKQELAIKVTEVKKLSEENGKIRGLYMNNLKEKKELEEWVKKVKDQNDELLKRYENLKGQTQRKKKLIF